MVQNLSLLKEKSSKLHNGMILIKSVLNQNQNHHYYNIFLEKYLYQLAKINDKCFLIGNNVEIRQEKNK